MIPGQDLYKEVLERYKRYVSLLNQGKREELQKELKENKVSPEEFGYIFTLSTYEKPVAPEYVFSDLNKDGQDELLIGNGQYLIWKIKNPHCFIQVMQHLRVVFDLV